MQGEIEVVRCGRIQAGEHAVRGGGRGGLGRCAGLDRQPRPIGREARRGGRATPESGRVSERAAPEQCLVIERVKNGFDVGE